VSITKKQKKKSNHFFTPRSNPGDDQFFHRCPPARYGGTQGKNATPYNQYHHTDRADTDQRRFQYTKGAQRSHSQFNQYLCEQDGRFTFNTPLQSSCRDVEVVLQQNHICPRRASSRKEHESRLGVLAWKGLQQRDDLKGHLPAVRGKAGAIHNQPICI